MDLVEIQCSSLLSSSFEQTLILPIILEAIHVFICLWIPAANSHQSLWVCGMNRGCLPVHEALHLLHWNLSVGPARTLTLKWHSIEATLSILDTSHNRTLWFVDYFPATYSRLVLQRYHE